jgi:hypothetical protein
MSVASGMATSEPDDQGCVRRVRHGGVSGSDGIASITTMGRAAWFADSEPNIMCLDDANM